MTLIGLFIKGFLVKSLAFLKWGVQNWRVTLPIVLCVLVALAVKHHITVAEERDEAIEVLERYVDQARRDQEARQRENKNREDLFAREQEETKAEHTATIEKLKESYNALLKNKDATIADAAALRDSLRRKLNEAYATARLSEGTDRPVRLTEIGQNCNAAGSGQTDADYINTLEYACAITTANYNTLYDRCEAVNKIFGVQQP